MKIDSERELYEDERESTLITYDEKFKALEMKIKGKLSTAISIIIQLDASSILLLVLWFDSVELVVLINWYSFHFFFYFS